MKKIVSLLILNLIISFNQRLAAQNCISFSDTVYVFLLQYELNNGRPVNSFFVLKDLNRINTLQGTTKQKDFLCWFYKNSNTFQFPETSDFRSCYSFENDKAKKAFFKKLYKNYNNMNKSYLSFYTKTNVMLAIQ